MTNQGKTYSNKSNATRAGGKLPEGTSYTVDRLSDSDRWAITAHVADRAAAEAIAAIGVAHSIVLAAAPEPVAHSTFQTVYNGHRADGKSMCRALRWTAATYTGTRKDFIADAVALGMNANNVSAEWASYRRKGKR